MLSDVNTCACKHIAEAFGADNSNYCCLCKHIGLCYYTHCVLPSRDEWAAFQKIKYLVNQMCRECSWIVGVPACEQSWVRARTHTLLRKETYWPANCETALIAHSKKHAHFVNFLAYRNLNGVFLEQKKLLSGEITDCNHCDRFCYLCVCVCRSVWQ